MPPPRYNEGTLIDAMQNAWRFVEAPAMRERLKEAKGIGTPATRAEIIKGLTRQNLLVADGKLVVPTPAGLQLFELLRDAAPALVDPGTTAQWEMQLDAVVTGRADFRAVIDGIAAEAETLIVALRQRPKGAVDLQAAPPAGAPGKKRPARKPRGSAKVAGEAKVADASIGKAEAGEEGQGTQSRQFDPRAGRVAPERSPDRTHDQLCRETREGQRCPLTCGL